MLRKPSAPLISNGNRDISLALSPASVLHLHGGVASLFHLVSELKEVVTQTSDNFRLP